MEIRAPFFELFVTHAGAPDQQCWLNRLNHLRLLRIVDFAHQNLEGGPQLFGMGLTNRSYRQSQRAGDPVEFVVHDDCNILRNAQFPFAQVVHGFPGRPVAVDDERVESGTFREFFADDPAVLLNRLRGG